MRVAVPGLRLRLAEAATHRRGLKEALKPYRETVKAALAYLDVKEVSGRVIDAIQAKVQDTKADIADMQEDETMTRRALERLGSQWNDAYETAIAALREDTQQWWTYELQRNPNDLDETAPTIARKQRTAAIAGGTFGSFKACTGDEAGPPGDCNADHSKSHADYRCGMGIGHCFLPCLGDSRLQSYLPPLTPLQIANLFSVVLKNWTHTCLSCLKAHQLAPRHAKTRQSRTNRLGRSPSFTARLASSSLDIWPAS
jgi:hypothetical protein